MVIKKTLLISIFVFSIGILAGQQHSGTWLWPVEGAEAGSGILSAPQSHIHGEFNGEYLFITAAEGSAIVSPADGHIRRVRIGYDESLHLSYGRPYTGNFDESISTAENSGNAPRPPHRLTGEISIRTDDGRVIHITGLSGGLSFKTGQKIKKGEPLGIIHYSYYRFEEPTICLSVSRDKKSDDPMAPFGLKSSFVPPGEIKPVLSLTIDEAKEDLRVYIDALEEIFPGLYKLLTREELQDYVQGLTARLDGFGNEIETWRFHSVLRESLSKIHDTHIAILPPVGGLNNRAATPAEDQPKIIFGWIEDTLRVINAITGLEHLIGEEIVNYNGYAADTLKREIASRVDMYDGKVEGYTDYVLATANYRRRYGRRGSNSPNNLWIEFADGRLENFEGEPLDGRPYIYSIDEFLKINKHPEGYNLRMLNDSTAYIGLSSFELSDTDVENIAAFIDSLSDVGNLIVDVRNNRGGHEHVLSKLYSYIAGDSMTLCGYNRVNKRGNFYNFKYCESYGGMVNDIFPDFVEGEEGYYQYSNEVVAPDSVVNYKGKVYVLANEHSISAATLFPALLVRNHRGVVVGRETRGAYHFMNALKSLNIRLPNSTITVRMPMVETVFDTIVNERVPYGRGVLPDYYVPITIDEMSSKEGDAILNYTLNLIKNGEYLKGENPFEQPESPGCSKTLLVFGGILTVAVALSAVPVLRYRKSRDNRT